MLMLQNKTYYPNGSIEGFLEVRGVKFCVLLDGDRVGVRAVDQGMPTFTYHSYKGAMKQIASIVQYCKAKQKKSEETLIQFMDIMDNIEIPEVPFQPDI